MSWRRLRMMANGARLRCPACGEGHMSTSWRALLTLRERCASCRIPFIPGPGEYVGGVELAVYASAFMGLVGFLLLLPAQPPWWASTAWVLAFGLVFPILTYRNFRGAWVGTMYAMRAWPAEGDEPHEAPIDVSRWPWDE